MTATPKPKPVKEMTKDEYAAHRAKVLADGAIANRKAADARELARIEERHTKNDQKK